MFHQSFKETTQLEEKVILQDEIHLGEETREQHGKRNQIFHHHSHGHIHTQRKRICNKNYKSDEEQFDFGGS